MFFYEFDDKEITAEVGQSMELKSPAPVRAARAYLQSGRRFQSACGISDIWYHHVESNAGKFMEDPPPLPNLQPLSSVYPGPDEEQIRAREPMFEWQAFHKPTNTSKVPARSALPTTHILVPSSSPLARAIGQNVPQAKGDSVGKKRLSSKHDEAMNSKPKASNSKLIAVDSKPKADSKPQAGGFAIEGLKSLHTKVVSCVGLETRRNEANREQTEKKQAPVKAERAPGHASDAGGSADSEDYPMDDWVLNSSFNRELGTFLEGIDSAISDERKEGKMKQAGDKGRGRELEENFSNGRHSSASDPLSTLKRTLQMTKLRHSGILERGSGKCLNCLHVLMRKTRHR